jgi:hypothetical protein
VDSAVRYLFQPFAVAGLIIKTELLNAEHWTLEAFIECNTLLKGGTAVD